MSASGQTSNSLPESVLAKFLAAHPDYESTRLLDEWRDTEYSRLDRSGQIYLDYTGGSLHAASQLTKHYEELSRHVFGNPHSTSPTSRAMTERVEAVRSHVLRYFNAPPEEYLVAFTPNASGALHEIGEAYPFALGSRYLLTFDNHNSVNGIREFARTKGAEVTYTPLTKELRIDRAALSPELQRPGTTGAKLFAFPAQSNFSGVQHPLDLIAEAQAAGWDVLLDAAAFVATNRLDVARWKPDLVALSFYKMFGYPTGVGALLMRRTMFEKLKRPWFAGGTIQIATVQGDSFYRTPDASAFEDGTIDCLNIPAVGHGLTHLESIGIDLIHRRVRCLTAWLLERMATLRHANGKPLVRIHGPAGSEARGGTIAFNLLDPDEHAFDIRRVEELAAEARISLRTGCFCNPGAGEAAYGLSAEQIGRFFHDPAGMSFDVLRERIRREYGLEVGAIRVSVGIASNLADVEAFLAFAARFRDRTFKEIGLAASPGACAVPLREGS
ncbi:MAG: aminotransferase class V-fold PLP-dependent enzyme [Candidatus Eisenbacteria bacterium]